MSGGRLEDTANYKYFRERLDDVGLMDRVVVVPTGDGLFDLAVPVGGRRRAGSCEADPVHGAQVIAALRARPGDFPDLRWDYDEHRLMWGVNPDDTIEQPWEVWEGWGKDVDPKAMKLSDAAYERLVGGLYGYSDEAIKKHIDYHGFGDSGQ